jgi:hypothetical protein
MSALRKPLPPYGKDHVTRRGHAWVAIGERAWELPKRKAFPVMVVPPGEDPHEFTWPVRDQVVTVIELGSFDTDRLDRLALALLLAGARRVIAVREAQLRQKVSSLAVYARDAADARAA